MGGKNVLCSKVKVEIPTHWHVYIVNFIKLLNCYLLTVLVCVDMIKISLAIEIY